MDVSDTIGLLGKSLRVEEEPPLRSMRLTVTKDSKSFAKVKISYGGRRKGKGKHT